MWKLTQFSMAFVVGLGIGLSISTGRGCPQPAAETLPATSSALELLKHVDTLSSWGDSGYRLQRTLDKFPPEQLPRIAQELREIVDPKLHPFVLLQAVIGRWATHDPNAAREWVQRLPRATHPIVVMALVYGMAQADPEGALRYARGLPSHSERNSALISIANIFSDSNPAAAFAVLKSIPGAYSSSDNSRILGDWARRDPTAAAAEISQLPADQQSVVTSTIFHRWAETDHSAALAAAAALKHAKLRQTASSAALETWARLDPAAAAGWFISLPSAEQAKIDPSNLLAKLTAKDPPAALSLLAKLNGRARANVISRIATTWAETDPEAAWTWMLSLTVASEKSSAAQSLSYSLRDEEITTFIARSKQLTNPVDKTTHLSAWLSANSSQEQEKLAERYQELGITATQLLLFNPGLRYQLTKTAPAFLIKLLQTPSKVELIKCGLPWSELADRYAAQNPVGAYAWAVTFPPHIRDEMLESILLQLARTDPLDALHKAQARQQSFKVQETIPKILSEWAASDPTGLEQATDQMVGAARRLARQQLIEARISEDPRSATDYLLQFLQNGRQEDAEAATSSASKLAEEWAEINPPEAAAWLAQLPAGGGKDNYAAGLAKKWPRMEIESAKAWIKELPEGGTKDGALANFISNLGASNFDVSLSLAQQIQEQAQRDRSYEQTLRLLLLSEPAAGLKAIDAAPISSELKDRLRRENLDNY